LKNGEKGVEKMTMNERETALVTQAKEGDSKAFEELYSR